MKMTKSLDAKPGARPANFNIATGRTEGGLIGPISPDIYFCIDLNGAKSHCAIPKYRETRSNPFRRDISGRPSLNVAAHTVNLQTPRSPPSEVRFRTTPRPHI